MQKLSTVIGPAPHERLFPDLIEFLQKERERVVRILSRPVRTRATKGPTQAKPKRTRRKKTISLKELEAIALATGVSVADLRRG